MDNCLTIATDEGIKEVIEDLKIMILVSLLKKILKNRCQESHQRDRIHHLLVRGYDSLEVKGSKKADTVKQ
jgi:hypothetical protein